MIHIVNSYSIFMLKLSQKLVKKDIPGNFIYHLKNVLQELALLNFLKTGYIHDLCI